ncbi:MAG TPA: hypothetical protein VLF39_02100 [Candidatus Saccharimonadales bacterium]|nr:hypothetical protein [Candidatus Saccharimonadales bacterium]
MVKLEAEIPNEAAAEVFALVSAGAHSGEIDWHNASENVHSRVFDAVLGVSGSILQSPDAAKIMNSKPFPEPPTELLAHRND